jgi:hypothetical protein
LDQSVTDAGYDRLCVSMVVYPGLNCGTFRASKWLANLVHCSDFSPFSSPKILFV